LEPIQELNLNLEKLVLRISYRDIKVLLGISNSATTAMGKATFLQPEPKGFFF